MFKTVLLCIFTGTNIAEQLDAANVEQMACSPPSTSPVGTLPPPNHDMYNQSMVPPVNVPGSVTSVLMQSLAMLQDRKFVSAPSTSLPGGVIPKTERFDS